MINTPTSPALSSSPIPSSDVGVETYNIGSKGFVQAYLRRMKIAEAIDSRLRPHGNWQGLSFGQLLEVFMLYLLEHPHSLYRAEAWVSAHPYLSALYPGLVPSDLSDDRLDILLDKLDAYGVSQLYTHITLGVMDSFSLNLDHIHVDLTNFSLYGNYPDQSADQPFQVVIGRSKSGRKDLKQFSLGTGVSGDGGVPIGMGTYDGNVADVNVYVPFWNTLCQSLNRSNFLLIGDRKLSSYENRLAISKAGGYYLAPLAMYAGTVAQLKEWIVNDAPAHEVLRKHIKDKQTGEEEVLYKGFEVPGSLLDPETDQHYGFRHCVIWSRSLEYTSTKAIKGRLEKALKELEELKPKLNKRKLVSEEAIRARIKKICSACKAQDWIDVQIESTTEIINKQIGRGKPHENTLYQTIEKQSFEVAFSVNEERLAQDRAIAGYYIMVTNETQQRLPLQAAFDLYKEEYKVEDVFRRLKGNVLQTLPMYLQLPRRINAMMFILCLAAQLLTLIDREAQQNLQKDHDQLEGIFPNKITTPRPKAERMMEAFKNVNLIEIKTPKGSQYYLTTLNPIQNKILKILNVKPILYQTELLIPLIHKFDPKITET